MTNNLFEFRRILRTSMVGLLGLAIQATAYLGSGSSGSGEFSFLGQHTSARAAGLMGAGALQRGDAGSLFSNPAALAPESDRHFRQVSLSANTDPMGGSKGLASYVSGDSSLAIAYSVAWNDYGDIQGLNEDGYADTAVGIFRPGNLVAGFTAVFPSEHLRWGITGRFLSEKLANTPDAELAMGWSVDWGAIYIPKSPRWSLGVSALNLGRKETAHVTGGLTGGSLNSVLRSDLLYRPASLPRLRGWLAVEVPRSDPARARLGGEYILSSAITLRAGTRGDLPGVWRDTQRLFGGSASSYQGGNMEVASGGVGLKFGGIQTDYAAVILEEGLGVRHNIGLTLGF